MVSAGGESPTGVFERIGKPIQAGDTDVEGAGGIGIEAANGVAGIALVTRTAPATATAAELLESNENGKRMRCGGPEASRAPSDSRSHMERMVGKQALDLMQLH